MVTPSTQTILTVVGLGLLIIVLALPSSHGNDGQQPAGQTPHPPTATSDGHDSVRPNPCLWPYQEMQCADCEATCEVLKPPKCVPECSEKFCQCKRGHARKFGSWIGFGCVPEGECLTLTTNTVSTTTATPNPCLWPYQEMQCAGCEATCEVLKPPNCVPKCSEKFCQCKRGYARKFGSWAGFGCVLEETCSIKTASTTSPNSSPPAPPTGEAVCTPPCTDGKKCVHGGKYGEPNSCK